MTIMGPNDRVNFLPAWYIRDHRRRVHRHRIATAVVMAVVVVVTMVGLGYNQRRHLQFYRDALQRQLDAAEGQYTEVVKLQEAHAELRRQVRIYHRLARPVSMGQVNAAIAALTPDPICLTKLDMKTSERSRRRVVADQVDAGGRPLQVTDNVQVILIALEGVAPSDLQVANYVGRLAGCGLFGDVQMAHARQDRIDNAQTRQFRIHMTVPLDRDYRMIASAEEVRDDR